MDPEKPFSSAAFKRFDRLRDALKRRYGYLLGDVAKIREHLPHTFLNIRLDPVGITRQTPEEIWATIVRLVGQSANPWLTGVCCINVDSTVTDAQVAAEDPIS